MHEGEDQVRSHGIDHGPVPFRAGTFALAPVSREFQQRDTMSPAPRRSEGIGPSGTCASSYGDRWRHPVQRLVGTFIVSDPMGQDPEDGVSRPPGPVTRHYDLHCYFLVLLAAGALVGAFFLLWLDLSSSMIESWFLTWLCFR